MICAEGPHKPEERFTVASSQFYFRKKASKDLAKRMAKRLSTDVPIHPHCQHSWCGNFCAPRCQKTWEWQGGSAPDVHCSQQILQLGAYVQHPAKQKK